jgi:histidine ammonia-lyase
MPDLILDGKDLHPATLWSVAKQAERCEGQSTIELAVAVQDQIERTGSFVDQIVEGSVRVYGINTGVGILARTVLSPEQVVEFQYNLLRSHAAGFGRELSRDLVMAMWLILLNSVTKGHRGLRPATVRVILQLLEAGVLGCVPARGSVGASGDLAPSAHAALVLIGEGECTRPASTGFIRLSAIQALHELGIAPVQLKPKEGLSLINGTQATTAMAVKIWAEAKQLLATANLAAALTMQAFRGAHATVSKEVLEAHRHPGTWSCGTDISTWIEGMPEDFVSDRVQDPYCLRCAPQVHGAVWESIQHSGEVLYREVNASTDNPLLFPETGIVRHGGNFHAIYPARVCDTLASSLTTLASIAERRIHFAMNKERTGLPYFLIEDSGFQSGFMMAQTTAAALVSECKSLSFPASVDSIPTNCDQEDHVSMGPIAGRKALQILKNVRGVLAIELLAGAQAMDLRRSSKASPRLARVYDCIRDHVPVLKTDRVLSRDIEVVATLISSGELLKIQS